jgi:hypothetical protein
VIGFNGEVCCDSASNSEGESNLETSLGDRTCLKLNSGSGTGAASGVVEVLDSVSESDDGFFLVVDVGSYCRRCNLVSSCRT